MDCSEVRGLLEEYVSGDLDRFDSLRVRDHLCTCSECEREHRVLTDLIDDLRLTAEAFRPRLSTVPATRFGASSKRRRGIAVLAAAAVVAAAIAALAVAPAVTHRSSPPSGRLLSQLRRDVRAADRTRAAAVRVGRGTTAVATATPVRVRSAAGGDRAVSAYMGEKGLNAALGSTEVATMGSLPLYTLTGGSAERSASYFMLGARRTISPAMKAAQREALVVVRRAAVDRTPGSAVVLVRPVSWAAWVIGTDGSPRVASVSDVATTGQAQSLVLTEVPAGSGHWRVRSVAGGTGASGPVAQGGHDDRAATALVVKTAAPLRTTPSIDPDLPRGVGHTVRRFVRLLRRGDDESLAAMFVDHRDLSQSLDPYWAQPGRVPALRLRAVGLTPVSEIDAAADREHLFVTIDIAYRPPAAGIPLFAQDGPGVPPRWELEQTTAGDWLIVAIAPKP